MLTGIQLSKVLWAITGLGLYVSLMAPLAGQDEEKPEKESQYTLPVVIVTATRVDLSLKEVPLSSAVITREALESGPALDVGDILRTQAGVHVRSNNRGGVATASLRGSQSSQVLVVRDGLPINDAFNGLTDLSRLMLGGIERIEIVRGPTSHLYGANALGGVINLITREPEQRRDFMVAYGRFNTQQYQLHAGQGSREKGAMVSAVVNKSDGWRGNDDFLHRSVLGRVNTTIGKVQVSVLTGYDDSEVGVPGPKPDSTATHGNNDVTSLFDRQKTDNLYGLLSIESRLGNDYNLQLRLRPERSTTVYENKYDDFSGLTNLGHNQYTAQNLRLSGQVEKRMDTNHILAGFDVIQERGFVEQRTTIEPTGEESTVKWSPATHSSALWSEYIWRRTNLVAVFGARFDYHSTYGWHTSPSLGIILHLGANIVRFSAGEAYRAPSFNDLFWPDDGLFSGNPDLKSETGIAYEIGLEHRISQAIRGTVAVFRRDVDDMIAWAPTGLNGLWRPSNINRYLLNGAEAELIAQKEVFNARFSYTYLDGRQTNLEVVFSDWMAGDQRLEHIERPAAFIPTHNVGFDLTYISAFFKINLNGEARSEIVNYYSDEYTNPAAEVSMIEKKLPARTVMNVRVSWPLWKFEPFLEVRNLLNSTYSEQFGSLSDSNYPLPGRTFGIGLRAEF